MTRPRHTLQGPVLVLACVMSGTAFAEPSVGIAHVPVVVFAVAVIAFLATWVVFLLAKRAHASSKTRWILTLVFLVLFLIFAAPFLFVLGSILVTGRTM